MSNPPTDVRISKALRFLRGVQNQTLNDLYQKLLIQNPKIILRLFWLYSNQLTGKPSPRQDPILGISTKNNTNRSKELSWARAMMVVRKEVYAEVDAELEEELVHLAEVGSVSVGVEERGARHGIPDVHGNDLSSSACGEAEHLHVLTVGEAAQPQHPRRGVRHHLIRRRRRRKEGQLRGHRRRHAAHRSYFFFTLPFRRIPLQWKAVTNTKKQSEQGKSILKYNLKLIYRRKVFTIWFIN